MKKADYVKNKGVDISYQTLSDWEDTCVSEGFDVFMNCGDKPFKTALRDAFRHVFRRAYFDLPF